MKNILILFMLFITTNLCQAQIWEPHTVNFPRPTQGWRITPANDSVAWTFGFVLDSLGDFIQEDYSYSRTTNGGNTWISGTFPGIQKSGYFSNIFSDGPDNAWIAFTDYTEGGKIFHTDNGGQSWVLLDAPIADLFVGIIYFWDRDHGIITGDPIDNVYPIFTTDDGGFTWQKVGENNIPPPIDNDEYTVSGNFAVNGDNIWFETYYNRVFYSPDRGHNWTVWENPTTGEYGLDLKADEDNFLYFIQIIKTDEEDHFELFRRHPDDTDWTNITPIDNSKYISGFSHVPGTKTLIINLVDETRISYNHGKSWISVDSDTTIVRGFTSFVNDQIGYCCQLPLSPGRYEHPSKNVYKYIGTPLSGLLNPKPIDINMAVSPSPASDHIILNIEGIHPADYWILINDITGKLMFKAEITKETVFSKTMDVSALAKGLYAITVSNSQGLRTQKFMKM